MNTITYQCCTRCVMDTSDPNIYFDSNGICNHCHLFDDRARNEWFPNDEGRRRWDHLIQRIKSDKKRNEYDCILGLSGGVDSSYLALKVHEWGLNPLVVHVDAGWNSELAVSNIESIINYCKFDLYTHVVDWEEIRDLQVAYLQSSIANQDVPQDHIFFASLYHFAVQNNIRYVLSGGNLATEGIFPASWHGSAMDSINLRSIHRKYGKRPLKHYKTISFFEYYILYPFIKGMRTLRPLNYLNYNKNAALHELERVVGYKRYPRKHGESMFTKVFQNYYLPVKFGYDKRRPHLSSLIVSHQLTRDEAVNILAEPLYDAGELEIDINFFCKKLRITRQEFDTFMAAPNRHYSDFPNWDGQYRVLKKTQKTINRLLGKDIRAYS